MLSIFIDNRVKKDLLIILKYEGVHSNLAMTVYNKKMSTANFTQINLIYYNKLMSTAELHSNQSYITK